MHCSKKGQRLFLFDLVVSVLLFICKGKQAQKRDWAGAEDLVQWCCCTVRANAVESYPQEHSSHPNEKRGGCLWAQRLLGHMNQWGTLLCWLWKYCVQHHCSRKCKSWGLSCTRCRMLRTHNLMPMQRYFGGQREGFYSLERVVVLQSCSTEAVKMKQSAIKPTWMVIYEQTCPVNRTTKG